MNEKELGREMDRLVAQLVKLGVPLTEIAEILKGEDNE